MRDTTNIQEKPGSQSWSTERTFDCTPEEMWAAWTDPVQLAKWISPFPGVDAEVHELDARVGGKVRFTMIGPDGTRFPTSELTYEVLDPPHEIVQFEPNDDRDDIFAGHPMRMHARSEKVGDKTRMIFKQSGLPATFPVEEAKKGFGACFDQLEALLTE